MSTSPRPSTKTTSPNWSTPCSTASPVGCAGRAAARTRCERRDRRGPGAAHGRHPCHGQAIVGSAAPICLSVGGLIGAQLLGQDKSLATLPVTSFNVGVALGALPAAA